MVKLSAIQLCSAPDVNVNLAAISYQLTLLQAEREESVSAHIVVLPECCLFFGGKDSEQLTLAQQSVQNQSLVTALSDLAMRFEIYLVGGTIPILVEGGDKFTNTCCVFSPAGELLTSYDKIHLFDVQVNDKESHYLESRYTQAGKVPKTLATDFATLGLSTCFDMRFPVLYQQLTSLGATIITVPSAFTRVTGKAHWQALLQARAIENQVYVIAAAQEGVHANGRETWGHSMIISPWGEILQCLPKGEGAISAYYQNEEIKRIRQSMPLLSNLHKN